MLIQCVFQAVYIFDFAVESGFEWHSISFSGSTTYGLPAVFIALTLSIYFFLQHLVSQSDIYNFDDIVFLFVFSIIFIIFFLIAITMGSIILATKDFIFRIVFKG